jgi:hypothetical protein
VHHYSYKSSLATGKSILLLGVYLLHFAFFQFLVTASADAHHASFAKLFPYTHDHGNNHSSQAVFRILEKHDGAKDQVSFIRQIPACLAITANHFVLEASPYIGPPLHYLACCAPGICYRLFLMVCVFRI